MNVFSFTGVADQFFMFGGFGGYDGNKNNKGSLYSFNLKTRKWSKVNENNENHLERNMTTTTLVSKSRFDSSVYVIGGNKFYQFKDMIKLTCTAHMKYAFWMLHYLEATTITGLISRNLHEDILTMFFDH